jgi:rubrerythrin
MTTDRQENVIPLYLDLCSKIEGLCAELYHYYSEIFHEDVDCSRLWKKTALEEENHQKLFELANRLKFDCEVELTADFEKASRAYSKLNTLLSHVRQTPPDIFLAITKAIEMEEALADLHLDSSIKFKDEQVQNMFKALQTHDIDHIDSLRHYQAVLFLPKTEMVGYFTSSDVSLY